MLLIDDEADQASIDTRGDYRTEEDDSSEDAEEPTPINSLIRDLLAVFQRSAYVAYTATPFANILIPHDSYHPQHLNDLYPKDFIVDLPKPYGYFGAEELFGLSDDPGAVGLEIFEDVTDEDITSLENECAPAVLRQSIVDFVLAGAARAMRGQSDSPATMLIHISRLRSEQHLHRTIIEEAFGDLRDQWRYHRNTGIQDSLRVRWESFRSLTRALYPSLEKPFEDLLPYIGPFLEAVQIKTLNMDTGDVLDYEREPSLKAIAIGGNK
ncbi:MAG: Z1 domain-containing protein, partial [Ktedonobacteraceae bacterium]